MINTFKAQISEKTAAIIIIGNEILTRKVVDQNASFLLKELYELGVKVTKVEFIPDVIDVISTSVKVASDENDFVFTSGGIGPTHDDITFEAIAKAFSLPLVEYGEVISILEKQSYTLNKAVRKMALFPETTKLVYDAKRCYPISVLKNIYIFPGVPSVLRAKFEFIKETFRASPYFLVKIYTRQKEREIASYLEDTLTIYKNIEIGSYPNYETKDYSVLITMESKNIDELQNAEKYLLTKLDPSAIVIC